MNGGVSENAVNSMKNLKTKLVGRVLGFVVVFAFSACDYPDKILQSPRYGKEMFQLVRDYDKISDFYLTNHKIPSSREIKLEYCDGFVPVPGKSEFAVYAFTDSECLIFIFPKFYLLQGMSPKEFVGLRDSEKEEWFFSELGSAEK